MCRPVGIYCILLYSLHLKKKYVPLMCVLVAAWPTVRVAQVTVLTDCFFFFFLFIIFVSFAVVLI